MANLKEIIEQELDQYLEWPTADKSHVTTVSAKLFAEHVAQLYADHFRDAGKMVAPDVQGEPVGWRSRFLKLMREMYLELEESNDDPIPSELWSLWRELLHAAPQPEVAVPDEDIVRLLKHSKRGR